MADQKNTWPELVGKTGDEAKAQVAADRPDVTIDVLPEVSPVTMDYRPDRVRIFVNNDNKVLEVLDEKSPATMDYRPDRVRIIIDGDQKVVSAPQCG